MFSFVQFDLSAITYGIDPSLVIEILQQSVKSEVKIDVRADKKTVDEIVASLKSPKKNSTKYDYRLLI